MHLRRLTPPDLDAIERLLRSDATFHEDEIAVALELVEEALQRPDGDYRVIVCAGEGPDVLGYVCYGKTPMTLSTFDLYWVVTHSQARGRGVATRLIVTMEEEILRLGGRTVRVETSQLEAYGSARSLYARLSYDEAGRIPDFYRPGDDLIILAKRLELRAERGEPLPKAPTLTV